MDSRELRLEFEYSIESERIVPQRKREMGLAAGGSLDFSAATNISLALCSSPGTFHDTQTELCGCRWHTWQRIGHFNDATAFLGAWCSSIRRHPYTLLKMKWPGEPCMEPLKEPSICKTIM